MDYLNIAVGNLNSAVQAMLEPFPDREWYKSYITGKGNFRYDVATIKPYKGNRDPNHRPKYYKELREYLVERFGTTVVEGMEADDALGIEQYKHKDQSTCIVSIDKDMKTIPGWHYNPSHKLLFNQSIEDANRFLLWQMLVGDTTDNIPGINKIGPKTADKILEEYESLDALEGYIRSLYHKQYGEDGDRAFEEIRTLLSIKRRE